MIIDKLSKVLSVGDKVAYQSFKLNNVMQYGEIIELKRTRVVVSSIIVPRADITTFAKSGVIETVSSYDIIKL